MDNDDLEFKEDAASSVCEAIADLCDAIRETPPPSITVAQAPAPNVSVPTTVNVPQHKQPTSWTFKITSRDSTDKISEIVATPKYE